MLVEGWEDPDVLPFSCIAPIVMGPSVATQLFSHLGDLWGGWLQEHARNLASCSPSRRFEQSLKTSLQMPACPGIPDILPVQRLAHGAAGGANEMQREHPSLPTVLVGCPMDHPKTKAPSGSPQPSSIPGHAPCPSRHARC